MGLPAECFDWVVKRRCWSWIAPDGLRFTFGVWSRESDMAGTALGLYIFPVPYIRLEMEVEVSINSKYRY